MKQITRKPFAVAALAATLFAAPSVFAEDGDRERILPNEEELRELGDMAQRWMREFSDTMSPMAERLKEIVDDLDAYEAPEMLPNGDIIIRRKPDAPKPEAGDEAEDEGIAL